ncbi:NfeD family protein [Candidatus Omnitrophota bacterium]
MSGRLVLAIISTLLEEIGLVLIVIFGLPMLEIRIPLPVLIALMLIWAICSIIIYRAGSRALKRKPMISLPVTGSKGKVVSPLVPEGLIRIQSELWVAKSIGKNLDVGVEVIVLEQDGLNLVVRETSTYNLAEDK